MEQHLEDDNYKLLDNIKPNHISLTEWFTIILSVFITIPFFIFITTAVDELNNVICLSLFYLIPLHGGTFYWIYGKINERKQTIKILKYMISHSKYTLVIKDVKRDGDFNYIDVESSVNNYPNEFNISLYTERWRPFLTIKTDFDHPLTIDIHKIHSKNFYNFENKNLEKIVNDFNLLLNGEAIFNNQTSKKLLTSVRLPMFSKNIKTEAKRYLQILKFMKSIKDISISEKPILRDMRYNMVFIPKRGKRFKNPHTVTACIKCKESIKHWKKGDEGNILQCPKCGSNTITIIASIDENNLKRKILKISKIFEEN